MATIRQAKTIEDSNKILNEIFMTTYSFEDKEKYYIDDIVKIYGSPMENIENLSNIKKSIATHQLNLEYREIDSNESLISVSGNDFDEYAAS